MGKTDEKLEASLLGVLGDSPGSGREIVKRLSQRGAQGVDAADKKRVKKALKRLVKKGVARRQGKVFVLVRNPGETGNDRDNDESDAAVQNDGDSRRLVEREPNEASGAGKKEDVGDLPVAEKLRRSAVQAGVDKPKTVRFADTDETDLDEEIRRLEQELQADALSQSSDGDEKDDEIQEDDDEIQQDDTGPKEATPIKAQGNGSKAVLCLSTLKDERIDPLPEHLLPAPMKRKLKGIDYDKPESKKKAKKQTSNTDAPSAEIVKAVEEVLGNLTVRREERLPFYCIFCKKQCNSEQEFSEHQTTEFHKVAVKMTRKKSFCKLCQKQLNSISQLQEHVKSRPHRERLQYLKSKQQGGGEGSNHPNGRGHMPRQRRNDPRRHGSNNGRYDSNRENNGYRRFDDRRVQNGQRRHGNHPRHNSPRNPNTDRRQWV